MKTKLVKISIFIVIILYFSVGFIVWYDSRMSGYASYLENIFTFLYVVFLWPFVIGRFLLFNRIV